MRRRTCKRCVRQGLVETRKQGLFMRYRLVVGALVRATEHWTEWQPAELLQASAAAT
jgi:hypothetical protein